jgi:hypothetical protein
MNRSARGIPSEKCPLWPAQHLDPLEVKKIHDLAGRARDVLFIDKQRHRLV